MAQETSKWDGYTCTTDMGNQQQGLTFATLVETMRPLQEQRQQLEQRAKALVKDMFDIDTDSKSSLVFLDMFVSKAIFDLGAFGNTCLRVARNDRTRRNIDIDAWRNRGRQ